jgi:prepilin-type N-terminal cleavage/methylation domain-containing protein
MRHFSAKNNLKIKSKRQEDAGFGLLEIMISLTVLGICLAYAMPLFLLARIGNIKSQIRSGGLIVAQRYFDNIRATSIASLPTNDGKNSPNSVNPISVPAVLASPTASEKLLTNVMNRQYQVKLTYCENLTTTNTSACSETIRQVKIEVFYNAPTTAPQPIYTMSAIFTKF